MQMALEKRAPMFLRLPDWWSATAKERPETSDEKTILGSGCDTCQMNHYQASQGPASAAVGVYIVPKRLFHCALPALGKPWVPTGVVWRRSQSDGALRCGGAMVCQK